jgi:glutathione synthase/RimK-type ligase-like ATP-grasp enzyme
MLHKHQEVIVKPLIGFGGKNVIKISKLNDKVFEVHNGRTKKVIKERKNLELYLHKMKKGKHPYIVQYFIPLANVNKKPIDFRYIVQRKGMKSDWVITGKYAKIARPGLITTNLKKGARVVTVKKALQKSNIKNLNLNKLIADLDSVTLNAVKSLTSSFPKRTIWGIDLAVDKSGKVWIIEANSLPGIRGFRKLSDLRMYRTIKKYKAYNND